MTLKTDNQSEMCIFVQVQATTEFSSHLVSAVKTFLCLLKGR